MTTIKQLAKRIADIELEGPPAYAVEVLLTYWVDELIGDDDEITVGNITAYPDGRDFVKGKNMVRRQLRQKAGLGGRE